MHHQELPPRPLSTQEAGSHSAASRKSAEGLDPRGRSPGPGSELPPTPRARAPFQVRHPGRSPCRPRTGPSPCRQNKRVGGQAPGPLTPGKLGCPPRGLRSRETAIMEKLKIPGHRTAVKLGHVESHIPTALEKSEIGRQEGLRDAWNGYLLRSPRSSPTLRLYKPISQGGRQGIKRARWDQGQGRIHPVNPAATGRPRPRAASSSSLTSLAPPPHPNTHDPGQGGGDRPTSQPQHQHQRQWHRDA